MFKTLSDLARSELTPQQGKYVDFVWTMQGIQKLEQPVLADDIPCPVCGSRKYAAPYMQVTDPVDLRRGRICLNFGTPCIPGQQRCKDYCPTMDLKFPSEMRLPMPIKRPVMWPAFCEANRLGDVNYDITFESIDQSPGKIDYMRKFCHTPRGIIYMQGPPGTGKSYAALGMCELFTRTDCSAKFYTHKQLLREWTDSFTDGRNGYFVDQLIERKLLVIDDFGTGDISSAFISFFLDLINSRMQWSNRGTVITTNLSDQELAIKCKGLGYIDALQDRLRTGQLMVFNEQSRRKKIVL